MSIDPAVRPARPHPYIDEISAGHWEAAQRRRLAIQQCGDCGTFMHYPSALCINCQSAKAAGKFLRPSWNKAYKASSRLARCARSSAPGCR